jgi:hypothetical protein
MQMGAFIGTGILSNPQEPWHSVAIDSAAHAHHTLQMSNYNEKKNKITGEASEGSCNRRFKVLCWRKVDDVVRVFDKECGLPNVGFHHILYSIHDHVFHRIIV